MANSFQKLADILNIENARLSGDPKRLQVASQMQETKELKQATAQSEAEINKAIDESNLPESQKRLLKAMDLASKTKVLYDAQTQKPLTEKKKQDELAAQIKNIIAVEGRGSDKFNKEKGGNPNLLEFYDDYIRSFDIFEKRRMGLNESVPGKSENNPRAVSSIEEAEGFPAGTWISLQGNVVKVD